MSQTFVFEELDEGTREYLTAVRDTQGAGAPGVFAPVSSSMPGCGCIGGVILIATTLILTLTTAVNVIYDDPVRVAFLQTAGILLGGWLLFAGIRSKVSRGSKKVAGHWAYVDPLHLYQAYREQVKVTKLDDVVEANFTHNYNNGSYQNSVINILLGGNASASVTVNSEQRAEQMVVYMNYLAWARGPEGGERGSLPPASLGGLAKYVAKNDAEPKDAEDNINLNLVELDVTQVPEEPTREGRAVPSLLPYVVMIVGGLGVFFVMSKFVNPPLRDDAIAKAVLTGPVEPVMLRLYLKDERNTKHRDEVLKRLAQEYDRAVQILKPLPGDPKLRDGMTQLLESLKIPEDPIVSVRVTEAGGRAGGEERFKKMRDELVGTLNEHPEGYFTARGGIMEELAKHLPPVKQSDGRDFTPPRTAVGLQLIAFAEMPEDAKNAHIEVRYEFTEAKVKGLYQLTAKVEIRTKLDDAPVATYTEDSRMMQESQFNQAVDQLRDRILNGLVGKPAGIVLK